VPGCPCVHVLIGAVALALTPLAIAQEPQEAGKPVPTAPTAPAEAEFDIMEFGVEGNSVLAAREIERAVYRFLGEKRHFADVEGARKSLEDTYQRLGYQTVFVDIPEQKVEGGAIRLRVLEGTVDRSRVVGTRYFELGRIRGRVPELAHGSVPDFGRVQQELALVNRSGDLQVAPVLHAGRTPGTVDVDLVAKDTLPLHGDIDVDNHASPFTSPLRLNASLRYDNLWQREHSIGVNYQVAPSAPSQTNVLYGTYLWRFEESSSIVSLYGIRSNSNLALVGETTVLGNAKIAGARWIRPFDSGPGYVHSLTLGADYKDFGQTNIDAHTGNADPLPAIRYVPLSLTYGGSLIGASHTEQFSLGFITAPRGLFGDSDGKFRGRRPGVGTASWLAWKWDVSSEVGLGHYFGGFARLEGQWTDDALIPNEQFSIGGADSVRGYRESEIPGDKGAHGTLEVRFFPLSRPAPFGNPRSVYGLLFVDAAQVRLNEPLGPQLTHPSYHIASAGLGLRASGWYGLRLAADAAHVLRDGGSGVNGAITTHGETRGSLLLGYGF